MPENLKIKLDEWCEGCDQFEMETDEDEFYEDHIYAGSKRRTNYTITCKHAEVCWRWRDRV